MGVGFLVCMFGGLMGIFTAMGICAAIWGESVLNTAMGNPPDRSHPAFWLGFVIMVPSMIIGFIGGAPLCRLLQSYVEWKFNDGEKPDFEAWLKNLTK